MPIPAFTIDGILPPYVDPDGPGGAAEDMSPYIATATEVVTTLGRTDGRNAILRSWLQHRAAIRTLGFDRGFQWLDGSFVEQKHRRDLDIVTFLHRPNGIRSGQELARLLRRNLNVFERSQVKTNYKLDFFPVDLDGSAEALVSLSCYCLGLFSHRRVDDVWKGMLQIGMEDTDDDIAAFSALGLDPARGATGEGAT